MRKCDAEPWPRLVAPILEHLLRPIILPDLRQQPTKLRRQAREHAAFMFGNEYEPLCRCLLDPRVEKDRWIG
ncbi:hypothetical protein SAMCFNEI73_pB0310 (plasmid) [Sinorhizobium americanum]|uniref:Uncharacterized protein n=1 Tax=Sinorhizobium americanum TaxID=194963 RepID=A0A1L3LTV5_9HYPH|nr:hypothetical protein SAMCFNEI73_pB0310 [Sinorhizobium americanum]OAP44161.1 hypothetical protein ATC00_24530 [Sinorhizobium americanum]